MPRPSYKPYKKTLITCPVHRDNNHCCTTCTWSYRWSPVYAHVQHCPPLLWYSIVGVMLASGVTVCHVFTLQVLFVTCIGKPTIRRPLPFFSFCFILPVESVMPKDQVFHVKELAYLLKISLPQTSKSSSHCQRRIVRP